MPTGHGENNCVVNHQVDMHNHREDCDTKPPTDIKGDRKMRKSIKLRKLRKKEKKKKETSKKISKVDMIKMTKETYDRSNGTPIRNH
jgi:hypothetical protein